MKSRAISAVAAAAGGFVLSAALFASAPARAQFTGPSQVVPPGLQSGDNDCGTRCGAVSRPAPVLASAVLAARGGGNGRKVSTDAARPDEHVRDLPDLGGPESRGAARPPLRPRYHPRHAHP